MSPLVIARSPTPPGGAPSPEVLANAEAIHLNFPPVHPFSLR
jgi:hypothetical protein